MRFDLVTIFPDFFAGPLDHGILRRARETGIIEVNVQDLRAFTKDGIALWMTGRLAGAKAWC